MLRIILTVLAIALICPSPARAGGPGVVVRDPAAYAQTFADSMAVSGMTPIRDAFGAMLGGAPLAADVESGLRTYEGAISGTA